MQAVEAEGPDATARVYTIVLDAWKRSPEELLRFELIDILGPLRAHLYRAGLGDLPSDRRHTDFSCFSPFTGAFSGRSLARL